MRRTYLYTSICLLSALCILVSAADNITSTGGMVAPTQLSITGGCGWMSPQGNLYGCSGDSRRPHSSVSLYIESPDQLPADWELAVWSSDYSVSAAECTFKSRHSVNCPLPYMTPTLYGQLLPLWLQNSLKRPLTNETATRITYSILPGITSVSGCCTTDQSGRKTYGCALPSPMLLVNGAGFAQAFDGGSPVLSPIVLEGAQRTYVCAVQSFTEWQLVCSNLWPAMAPGDDQEMLQLSVRAAPNVTSNAWGVQVTSGMSQCRVGSSSGMYGLPPRITSIDGGGCTQVSLSANRTIGCTTNAPTLFTIHGSWFDVPAPFNEPVQLQVSTYPYSLYTCGISQLNSTTIVCISVQPTLSFEQNFRVTVITNNGASNVWTLQISADGPYRPPSQSSASNTVAGMSFLVFTLVVTIAVLAALAILAFAIHSCRSRSCLCFATPSSSASASAALPFSARLLDAPPALAAQGNYSSSSSRFGLSLPPNPSNYPAVPARDGHR